MTTHPSELPLINSKKWTEIYMWARYCGFNLPTFLFRAVMHEYPGTLSKFHEISEEDLYYACFEFAKYHLKHTISSPIDYRAL